MRLPLSTKLAFSAPNIAGAGVGIGIGIHINIFYSDTVLLPLGFIALAVAVARSFDAVTDPLMGWLSDRTNTRWGRRRPWIALAAPLAAIALVLLYVPPEGMSTGASAIWFTVCFVSFFLFQTMYAIPHYGLGPELTTDYNERSSLYGWLEAATLLGIIAASFVPGVLTQDEVLGKRDGFALFAVGFAVLLVLLYWTLCWKIQEDPAYYRRTPNPLVPGVRRTMRNRPFRILLISYLVGATTAGIPGLMWPFFATYVLKLGVLSQNILLASIFVWGVASIPLWVWSARRFGKKGTYVWARVAGAVSAIGMFFMREGDLIPAAALLALAGIAFGGYTMIGPSIQADVIDYDELYTGKRREAQYGSLWAIMIKFTMVPGAAIPLSIMATAGYTPNVDQTDTVIMTVMVLYGILPAVSALLSIAVFLAFPINERSHEQVLAGIARHKQGEPAMDPFSGNEVPPPGAGALDEERGWFLDHFSQRELRRALARPESLLFGTLWGVATSAVLFVASSWAAIRTLGDLQTPPGVWTVLLVVAAGSSFVPSLEAIEGG